MSTPLRRKLRPVKRLRVAPTAKCDVMLITNEVQIARAAGKKKKDQQPLRVEQL